MTTSKRSTESAIGIKKTPDVPASGVKSRAYLDQALDLYWGGSERRITNLTLKILGVNVIALLILLVGILYLGQYHDTLIEARLRTFQREVELVSVAFSQQSLKDQETGEFIEYAVSDLVDRLQFNANKTLYLFDEQGQLFAQTESGLVSNSSHSSRFHGFEFLKDSLGFFLGWLPERRDLPAYFVPKHSLDATDYPGVSASLAGEMMLSAWSGKESRIFLSASAPLIQDGEVWGALLLTWDAFEIEDDLDDVFVAVLYIFMGSLILTILLSIYLSGLISRPLKKLMRAAEDVRKGRGRAEDIPDFSHRFDEIGELSLVLREMTMALSERMDAIENFAADVSHELKNPLTSLRSAFETLSVVKKQQDKETLLEIIAHDFNRLDRLITDISHVSRLDSALSREVFGKVDLQALLHGLLQAYGDPLQRPNRIEGWPYSVITQNITVTLSCRVPHALYVKGGEGYLMQVFENILSNALSFSPQEEVVSIDVEPLGRSVAVRIENFGPLIPEGKLESIFERFYSERPNHEAYGQNSGLGLSICRQIMDVHGGQVFAENMHDEQGAPIGVRFTVLLFQF